MVRVAVIFDETLAEDYEKEVTLSDGVEWSDCVLNDMENANWHTQRKVFSPLIHLLPEIYKTLDPKLKKRLQHAVDVWDTEF